MPRWFRVPLWLSPRYWSAKRLAVLIGFVLTILGSVGTRFYVQPVQDLSAAADQRSKTLSAGIDTLKDAQAQYQMFRQQGSLIFALTAAGLSAPGTPQRDSVEQLYGLSLLDRSNAMGTIMVELTGAGVVSFDQVRPPYVKLISSALGELSLPAYTAVDAYEAPLMEKATAEMARRQRSLLDADAAKAAADAEADRRSLVLLALVTLGSAFLLVANLISTREAPEDDTLFDGVPHAASPSGERVLELTTAAQLIEGALGRIKAQGGGGTPPARPANR